VRIILDMGQRPNFVIQGGFKLPIGYRFHPTDEELVVHYLKRKVFSIPFPASVIPEFDVFQTDPWGLPGDLNEKRYFFSSRKSVNENKSKRAAGSGYWKPIGKAKQILASGSNQAVGMRKALIFCEGKRSYGTKTRWVMHEYRLVDSETNAYSTQVSEIEKEDWVIYCVLKRKKRNEKRGAISQPSKRKKVQSLEVIRPSFMNCKVEESSDLGPPQPSSSCSSEITDVRPNELDQEETSSHISFSSFSCMREA